jgi:hypothetical protein
VFASLASLPAPAGAAAGPGGGQHFGPGEEARCLQWAAAGRAALSASFERLAADGQRWEGRLGNGLNEPLSRVCEHSVHALMCMDLLLAALGPGPGSEAGAGAGAGAGGSLLAAGLVERDVDLKAMLEGVIIPDIESLTKEKFGACPDVLVRADARGNTDAIAAATATAISSSSSSSSGSSGAPVLAYGAPSLLSFVLAELLKNGLEAVMSRHGALDLEDAEMGEE